MLRFLLLSFLLFNSLLWAQSQQNMSASLSISIDKNVLNANDVNEREIIALWKAYLNAGEYKNPNSIYWDTSVYKTPDYFLWPVNIKGLKNKKPKVQCTILGVFPVEHKHYAIKTAITYIDKNGSSVIDAILSVFAKRVNGKFLLVNSSQYHKSVWAKKQIGKINYYIHPMHPFNSKEAEKMSAFNKQMAELFKTEPIAFDYFISNYSREIVRLWGYDYMAKIYIPGQTGGVADINNRIVYAGNNSEYYPHELVHIYTKETFKDAYHFWLNEGFATFIAGSGGHNLEWHIMKLKAYILKHPDSTISFKDLKGYIPNGLHSTEFRYVIGGLICKMVFEKKGMNAVLDGLKTVNTDADLYAFIEKNLGVKSTDFSDFLKKKVTLSE